MIFLIDKNILSQILYVKAQLMLETAYRNFSNRYNFNTAFVEEMPHYELTRTLQN